jgi:hypothetical protein
VQRFESRLRIVNAIIAVRREDPNGDHNAWEWLRELLLTLQPDGMSSEESDIEDGQDIYRATIMPWRRGEIANYMQKIDKQRLDKDAGFSERGSKPAKRVRGVQNPKSKRTHVNELPRPLYDDDWWAINHRKLAVEVSEDPFQWQTLVDIGGIRM